VALLQQFFFLAALSDFSSLIGDRVPPPLNSLFLRLHPNTRFLHVLFLFLSTLSSFFNECFWLGSSLLFFLFFLWLQIFDTCGLIFRVSPLGPRHSRVPGKSSTRHFAAVDFFTSEVLPFLVFTQMLRVFPPCHWALKFLSLDLPPPFFVAPPVNQGLCSEVTAVFLSLFATSSNSSATVATFLLCFRSICCFFCPAFGLVLRFSSFFLLLVFFLSHFQQFHFRWQTFRVTLICSLYLRSRSFSPPTPTPAPTKRVSFPPLLDPPPITVLNSLNGRKPLLRCFCFSLN